MFLSTSFCCHQTLEEYDHYHNLHKEESIQSKTAYPLQHSSRLFRLDLLHSWMVLKLHEVPYAVCYKVIPPSKTCTWHLHL